MIRDIYQDYAVLQTGFWRLEVDLAKPRFVSLRADPGGLIDYCQEMLEPGFGGESVAQTENAVVRSRNSIGHKIDHDGKTLCVKGICLGDFAVVDWKISLVGTRGETLQVEVTREIVKAVSLVIDVPFGFQCLREFAFWSKPSLRFEHNPAGGYVTNYRSYEERARPRVIGYHSSVDLPAFFIHGSPSYPDFEMSLNAGYHHVEQHYSRHVTFGVSSRDFSSGNVVLPVGKETWILQLKPVSQGQSAPVGFRSGNEAMNKFVPEFFDGYLLSSVACDHEYFGNNPYRHAYCPGAIHFVTRGFLATDRRSWHPAQGDMEARWKKHIRRTLAEGRVSRDRLTILLDSGVWQDACGAHTHEHGSPALDACFITACCQVLLKSGDKDFADEICDELEAIVSAISLFDPDNDGLLESPLPGTPGSPSSSYNDCLSEGHKDGYLNAVACEAFSLYGSLLEFLGKREKAAKYRLLAQRIIKAYNEQLWDDQRDRYVGWIDVNGASHDAWYTHINFPAVVAGIVPEDRLWRMMQSFIKHPNHHRIFAAGVCLDPVTDGCLHGKFKFGIWLNGGVLLGPASMELYARAVGLGGESAWDMLKDLLIAWNKNHLSQTPFIDWCRPHPLLYDERLRLTGGNAWTWVDGKGAAGAGTEPYLADGGAILWALYTGVLGMRPDFQGISFFPHLPATLADTEADVRFMGRNFKVKIRGYGDKLKDMRLDGRDIRGNRLTWDQIQENSVVDIFLDGDR